MDFYGPFLTWDFPWRPPDLGRFASTAQFRDLRSAAGNWIDAQFALIRAEAAWLAPVARLVSDYGIICGTSWRRSVDIGSTLRICFGAAACVRCQRQVAVAYGFDGELAGQVLGLMRVLEQAGWRPYLPTRRLMTGLQPIRSIPGPNGAAIGDRPGTYGQHEGSDPPHLQLVGPREAAAPPCTVQVVWTTRSDPGHTTLHPAFPAPRAALRRTPSYQPLEFSGALLPADISDFAAPALEQHEHAVAVMIELGYYYNRQAHTRPHRLPARLMPKWW